MGRKQYGLLTLASLAMILVSSLLLFFSLMDGAVPAQGRAVQGGFGLFGGTALLVMGVWVSISCAIRRLRDIGYSPLWLLLCLTPVYVIAIGVTIMFTLILSFMPGQAREAAA